MEARRHEEERETGRVEAFSDGIFAIAITLLVLELKVPSVDEGAGRQVLIDTLVGLWPSLAALVTSFVAILIMWMNHHGIFRMVHKVDGPFLAANGMLLLGVAFVPFPTAVLARNVLGPSATIAAAFYCGTFVFVNAGYNALLEAAVRGRLLKSRLSGRRLGRIRRAYRIAFAVYVAATGIALWNAHAGLALATATWLLWGGFQYSVEATAEIGSSEVGSK